MSRPTVIEMDLAALRHNCRLAASLGAGANTVAVVKADAYGHGAVDVAAAIADEVAMFAVSCLEEAVVLRDAGIQHPVLLLEGCFSPDEYRFAAQANLDMVVHHAGQIQHVRKFGCLEHVNVWLKIDSGMHRLGIAPEQTLDAYRVLRASADQNKIILTTHLASADNLDGDFTRMQMQRFRHAIDPILALGRDTELSIANSAALLGWQSTRADWNRPGIMLYGITPFAQAHPQADKLKPVMTLKSEVIAVRDIAAGEAVGYGNTWVAAHNASIATIAVGYGDGYPRTARSGTPVLVNGHRATLAGRVSMDMISVDVTGLPKVEVGDPVELWGNHLDVNEVAGWADSIGYELVTRMPKRTRRTFVE